MPTAAIEEAVVARIEEDTNQMRGPLFIKELLQEQLICVLRQVLC